MWKTDIDQLDTEELWEHYERCLAGFDWTHAFSDDHGIFEAGREQEHHIGQVRRILTNIDKDRAEKLYYKYSFWHDDDGKRKEY